MIFFTFRGSSSDQANIFRSFYGRLSELRSLVFNRIPVVSLTATSTSETTDFIIDNLSLVNPKILSSAPERSNIRYSVTKLTTDPSVILKPLIENLKDKSYAASKVLIFCRTVTDVRRLYRHLSCVFGDMYKGYKKRPYARFHAKTHETIKDHVIQEFSKPDGTVRLLISTIAFGMGVNCQSLYQVIHFGPPAGLDDYFQEAGRVGRDGLQSEALLVLYPRCMGTRNISKVVKEYALNNSVCRRKVLLQNFNAVNPVLTPLHLCCDICQKICLCNGNDCSFVESFQFSYTFEENNVIKNKIVLCKEGEDFLKSKLFEIRNQLPKKNSHCGMDINSGFPLAAVNQIVSIASPNITITDIKAETSVFNEPSYQEIVSVVQETFELYSNDNFDMIFDTECVGKDNESLNTEYKDTACKDTEYKDDSSDNESDQSNSDDSFSSDDSEIDFDKYRAHIATSDSDSDF